MQTLVSSFGEFHLDRVKRVLLRRGQAVEVSPKCLDLLAFLVDHRNRLVEKEELLQWLWPESFVDEQNIKQNIYVLRRILGDDQNGNRFIQTIPRRGYKFIAPVVETDAALSENSFAERALTPTLTPTQKEYWTRHSPFRSLQVFEPEDAWLFFGRNSEIEELRERLVRSPVLTVVGNSGCGKSSLIRAGLIPALQNGTGRSPVSSADSWRVVLFRPSSAPFDYLAEVLPNQLAPELSLCEQADFIADCRSKLPGGRDALRNAISVLAHPLTKEMGQTRVLLVADQFEEIFTLTANRETRHRYIEALLAAARCDSAVPVQLVLTLRADFYSQCLEHPALSRCLADNLYNVPRMTQRQLRETIEKRLQISTAQAEPGLIDAVLEDAGDEPGNLALQEHALGQLWERGGGVGSTLTYQAYSEIGRLRGALGRHADAVYESFTDEKQKQLVQQIFLELVHVTEGAGVQDTRRRVRKTELLSLGATQEIEQLLTRLASSRLIATGAEHENVFVEVSHEALIREWPQLRDWLNHNREELLLQRRLLQAAQDWESLDKDAGALLRGARLAQGEEWLARTPGALPLLRDFVGAGIAARDEAERQELAAQKREVLRQKAAAGRLRWFVFALAALLLAAAGAALYTYRIHLMERSRTLAWHAEQMRDHDHGQALDFALRSWRIGRTEEARLAITKTFPQLVAALNHDDVVEKVAFSPDGQQILTASDDQTARLWSRVDGHLVATLKGHTGKVIVAIFSPDGQRIVTTSLDHTARVWSAADGHLLAILRGHTDAVWTPAFSPDGERILTPSSDHTVKIWNAADGRLLATLHGHTDMVAHAQFSADGRRIVTTSWDHTARLWSGAHYRLVAILRHAAAVGSAEFSPDSRRILTASGDGTARVWDSSEGHLLVTLRHAGVLMAKFSPDGGRIATGGIDQTARVWSATDGQLLATLVGHTGSITHLNFSPDGRLILTNGTDATARLWNSVDGQALATLELAPRPAIKDRGPRTAMPWDSAFSPDGRLVVAALGDSTARVWNISRVGDNTETFRSPAAVIDARFSPDGLRTVVAGADGTARIWSTIDARLLATLQGHSDFVYEANFSPDGQRVVTASGDKTARIWNSADGRLLATLTGHTDQVYRAQFSPDGQLIVTASGDDTARLWNGVEGRFLTVLRGHNDLVCRAQFSPDGQRVVTASWDHTARVWNSADGRLLVILKGHTDKLRGARFSPDGKRIITFSWDGTARVWNSTDGRPLAILSGHSDRISEARFSPDGQLILTASWDKTAKVWNGNSYAFLRTLTGHVASLMNADFSPDGQRIITSSTDGTARVWNSSDGRLLATLQGHTEMVTDAVFSPNGQRILTASYDRTARLWRVLTLNDIEHILGGQQGH
jgi:WD40 repeat protein/DNA-binding winged helix-turn-helix (wHTH) protein